MYDQSIVTIEQTMFVYENMNVKINFWQSS